MDAELSRAMADRAGQAVADAKTFGADLDYSVESIEEVERILGVIHNSKTRGGLISRLLGRSLSADDAARLARMYGAYVGECLIRTWGGHWSRIIRWRVRAHIRPIAAATGHFRSDGATGD